MFYLFNTFDLKKKLHTFTTESDRLKSETKLRNEMSVKFKSETIVAEEVNLHVEICILFIIWILKHLFF